MAKKPQIADGFEEAREAILDAALARAAFEGWGRKLISQAAVDVDIDSATLKAAFPKGAHDVIRFHSEKADEAMIAKMQGPEFDALRIRDKVTFGVWERIMMMQPHKEATRRAAAYMALPTSGRLGPQIAWNTSDAVWRGLGDPSTDFNWYTKRATLMGVWTSTMARWFADDSEGSEKTRAFLDARISNVMQFEKVKSQLRKLPINPLAPLEVLSRVRYPAGR